MHPRQATPAVGTVQPNKLLLWCNVTFCGFLYPAPGLPQINTVIISWATNGAEKGVCAHTGEMQSWARKKVARIWTLNLHLQAESSTEIPCAVQRLGTTRGFSGACTPRRARIPASFNNTLLKRGTQLKFFKFKCLLKGISI